MRTKEEYELAFDSEKLDDEELKAVFGDHKAKVLWVCIKSCHITSQHFNKNVLVVAKGLPFHQSKFSEFIRIVRPLSKDFGRVNIQNSDSVIDNEFWVDIYSAIYGGRLCKIVPPTPERREAVSRIETCPKCGKNIVSPAYDGDGAYPVPPMCQCPEQQPNPRRTP